MAKEFKNSRDKIFYIKSKQTKKGNTTYFMTKKLDEGCLEEVPDGFEVYEKPDTRVMYIRRKKLNKFGLKGINIIKKELEKNRNIADFKIDVNGEVVKVYTTDIEEDGGSIFDGGLSQLLNSKDRLDLYRQRFQRYEERMRIKLEEKKGEKEYFVYRYCYRGSVDDWIVIDMGENLAELAKNLQIIGTQEYFERYRVW